MNELLKNEAQLYRSILGLTGLFFDFFLSDWLTFTLGFKWKFG
jgi:hypothetical protein